VAVAIGVGSAGRRAQLHGLREGRSRRLCTRRGRFRLHSTY